MEILIVILVVGLIVAGAIASAIQARKRREALQNLAASLGLSYLRERDYSIDERYGFLSHLCSGSNRYAFNILSGTYHGHDVLAFDYHYETHSRDSKGRRHTHHHYLSFFILHLPVAFPELTISREGFFSKIAQMVGYDDIDFESAEFSRRFCVRSKDKRFAYDIVHARMMEYLLANDDLSLEIENRCLAIFFTRRLSVEEIARNLERLRQVRELFPEYLWQRG